MSLATYLAHKGSGAPSHSAPEGTIYWDTTNKVAYVNTNGSTSWKALGASIDAARAPYPGILAPMVDLVDGATLWAGCKFRGSVPDHPNIGGYPGIGSTTLQSGSSYGNGDDNDGTAATVTVTAGVGNYSYTQSTGLTAGLGQRRHVVFFGQFKMSQVNTNFRFFFGGASSGIGTPVTAGADNPNDPCMLIKLVDGTNWQLYTSNGGGDGGTSTNLIAATTGITWLMIAGDKDGVYGRAWNATNDSGWVTSGGTLPTATTSMTANGFGHGIRNSSAGSASTVAAYIQVARAR